MKRYVNTILVMLITLITVIVLVNVKPSATVYSKTNLSDRAENVDKVHENNNNNNDSNSNSNSDDSDDTGSFIFDY